MGMDRERVGLAAFYTCRVKVKPLALKYEIHVPCYRMRLGH